jgi:predicted SprT family Zn-dependent metalloprotease
MKIMKNQTRALNKHEFICLRCSVISTYKSRGRKSIFCSSRCKDRYYHDATFQNKIKMLVKCDSCGKEFYTSFDHQRFCSSECRKTKATSLQSRVFIYECSDCKTNFVSKRSIHGISASTGTRCKPCQKQLTRIRDRKKTLIRQKAISNPKISVEVIARRDHYLCHLCNQIVDMNIKRTDKMGATIDHILPLSKGGLDTMENVALAHWICNIRKGNRV